MKDVSTYLKDRLKGFTPSDRILRDTCIEAITEVCDVSLRVHEVSVRGKIVFITTNPILKNEVFKRRGEVVELCRKKLLGKAYITDLR